MKFLRLIWWWVAALPIAAAGFWASHAARMPEAHADREAMLEVTPRWEFSQWADVTAEPMHVFARATHLGALHIPGATISSVAWVNVLFALLIVAGLCDVYRRSFPSMRGSVPLAFGVFGLLVATPALGCNWLHGERLGLFAVPMLFVTALAWLQGEKRFSARAILAVLIAGIAPWFHFHGVIVATAMIPALLGAGLRVGSKRRMAWLGALLLAGDIAAYFSMRTAPGFAVAGADWVGALSAEPLETVMTLVRATGGAWLDLWPNCALDEEVFGIASWVMPIALLMLGNRSKEARVAAAPWWSCWMFGLLLMLAAAVRHELEPPVGTLREATLGSFLLPIGMVGVFAARFGTSFLAIAVGAFLVLSVQDWRQGIEELRVAVMRTQQVESELVKPEAAAVGGRTLPVASAHALKVLQERGWVPATNVMSNSDIAEALTLTSPPDTGRILGGTARVVNGTVRSSLRLSTPQWIGVIALDGAAKPNLLGQAVPQFEGRGRNVSWRVELQEPLAEGTRVRAVGLLVQEHALVPLGPAFVVKNGQLVLASGS